MEPKVIYEIKPALILDLDDTIRRSKSGKKFIQGPDDIELFPDVEPTLNRYRDTYYILAVSNQGGVAFNIRTEEQIAEEVKATLDLFQECPIMRVEVCMTHPNGYRTKWKRESMFRKPNTGMLAVLEYKLFGENRIIDWPASFMVGDRDEDRECAEKAGIMFQWAWEFFMRPKPIG